MALVVLYSDPNEYSKINDIINKYIFVLYMVYENTNTLLGKWMWSIKDRWKMGECVWPTVPVIEPEKLRWSAAISIILQPPR